MSYKRFKVKIFLHLSPQSCLLNYCVGYLFRSSLRKGKKILGQRLVFSLFFLHTHKIFLGTFLFRPSLPDLYRAGVTPTLHYPFARNHRAPAACLPVLPLLTTVGFFFLDSHTCLAGFVSDLKLQNLGCGLQMLVFHALRKASTQMSTFPKQIREWLFA